jgi:hypothetical protein
MSNGGRGQSSARRAAWARQPQHGNNLLEPLAANPICRLPDHDQRLPHRLIVNAAPRFPASACGLFAARPVQHANRVLPVKSRHLGELECSSSASVCSSDSASLPLQSVRACWPCSVASSCRPLFPYQTGNIFMRQRLRAGSKRRESMRTLVGKRFRSKLANVFSRGNPDSRSNFAMRFRRRASHSRSANSSRYCS